MSNLSSGIFSLNMNTPKLENAKIEVRWHFLPVFLGLKQFHAVFYRSCLLLCTGVDLSQGWIKHMWWQNLLVRSLPHCFKHETMFSEWAPGQELRVRVVNSSYPCFFRSDSLLCVWLGIVGSGLLRFWALVFYRSWCRLCAGYSESWSSLIWKGPVSII